MSDIRQKIMEKIAQIEECEQIKVLMAVESGSRAWGVESPDSDYDVRFVYIRKIEDYLRLEEQRDVIEWELDEVFDMNGWDLKKTLVHFHKGNATLFEWANSPVVYKKTEEWERLYEVCEKYFSKKAAIHHYRSTAKTTYLNYLQGETVRYKKYIYALRPLLACRYIEKFGKVPPVKFEDLLKMELPRELLEAISQMLEVKAKSDEKELNPRIPVIQEFIEAELGRFEELAKQMEDDRKEGWEALDRLFLSSFELTEILAQWFTLL